MASELDQTDRQLLELLQRDGLQSMAELSKAIGVAPSTLNDRVKRLGRLGVITGTHARLDRQALGLSVLAQVFVGRGEGFGETDFLQFVAAAAQVLECHRVTGDWDYLLKVAVADARALETFVDTTLRQVRGLSRVQTLIVLSSAKDTGMLPTG